MAIDPALVAPAPPSSLLMAQPAPPAQHARRWLTRCRRCTRAGLRRAARRPCRRRCSVRPSRARRRSSQARTSTTTTRLSTRPCSWPCSTPKVRAKAVSRRSAVDPLIHPCHPCWTFLRAHNSTSPIPSTSGQIASQSSDKVMGLTYETRACPRRRGRLTRCSIVGGRQRHCAVQRH